MTTFYRRPSVDVVQNALAQLRASRVPAIRERFDSNWAETGRWNQSIFDDETEDNEFPQSAAWELVRAIRFAGENLLAMTDLKLQDHEGAYFDVVADVANGTFSYAVLQPTTDFTQVQEHSASWPMDEPGFFDLLDFTSSEFQRDQFRVFDAWRPNGARTLTLHWSDAKPVPFRSADAWYPNWQVGSTEDMVNLATAIRRALPPPENKHERGRWHQELTADFKEGTLALTQREVVALEHQLAAGVLPLDELVWLVSDRPRKAESEPIGDFATTGIAAVELRQC